MSGFPAFPLRGDFGPEMRNLYPVENPEIDYGADQINLANWQLAGTGLMVCRAILIAEWDGSAFTVLRQDETWNPRRDQSPPVLARVGTGDYTYTVAGSYPDKDGVSVPVTVFGARATILSFGAPGLSDLPLAVANVSANVVSVVLGTVDAGGAGAFAVADYRFLLEVF